MAPALFCRYTDATGVVFSTGYNTPPPAGTSPAAYFRMRPFAQSVVKKDAFAVTRVQTFAGMTFVPAMSLNEFSILTTPFGAITHTVFNSSWVTIRRLG